MRKLQFIKKKLKEWNKTTFRKIHESKNRIWSEMQAIDSLYIDGGIVDEGLVSRRKSIMAEMETILKSEEIF